MQKRVPHLEQPEAVILPQKDAFDTVKENKDDENTKIWQCKMEILEEIKQNPGINSMNTTQNEIVLYQPNENVKLGVRIENETVWLSQMQMVALFQSTKQNISLHINNVYKENELDYNATVKEYLTVQKEGSRQVPRFVKYFNLDVIISVGYRVKSLYGTQFRIWANSVLKDYLLRGYAVNFRLDNLEHKVFSLEQNQTEIKSIIQKTLPPQEGIFFDGQIFDAYSFVSDLIKSAKRIYCIKGERAKGRSKPLFSKVPLVARNSPPR